MEWYRFLLKRGLMQGIYTRFHCLRAVPPPREAEQKFFGSFFQKRTAFFYFLYRERLHARRTFLSADLRR
jgi:hypothetical protein